MNLRDVLSIANNIVLYLKKNKTKLLVRAIVDRFFLIAEYYDGSVLGVILNKCLLSPITLKQQ